KRGDVHIVKIRKTPVVLGRMSATDPIQRAYDELRDADTLLGEPTGNVEGGTAGAVYRQYQHGQIILPPGLPTAVAIYGPFYEAHDAPDSQGAKLAPPLSRVKGGYQGSRFLAFEHSEIILPHQAEPAYLIYGPYCRAYLAVEDAGPVFGVPRGTIQ